MRPLWLIIGSVLALCVGSAHAEYGLNMTRGVTEISHKVYDLHMTILWICVAIGVVVFGAMLYSIIYHRKSKGAKAANFHHSTFVEIVWTVIPFAILIFMAIPAAKTLIHLEDSSESEMSVLVTGYQWKWKYEYVDRGLAFMSTLNPEHNEARQKNSGVDVAQIENYLLDVDEALVVPVNTKIRFLTTAADVIHSWWVPALGWKRDAIPGFVNESWAVIEEVGVYRGQCAELCGKDHGFMPIVIKAVSKSEFESWLTAKKESQGSGLPATGNSLEDLVAAGEKIYNKNCAACHQVSGAGIPGAFPSLIKSPVTAGPVDAHIKTVLNGVPTTAMGAFGGQLQDWEIAAVVTYERNAWGQNSGEAVQPADVKAQR